ncbi:hypothetical protein KRX52_10705 [Pseudomonas sp. MAP12]|uniref:CopG-like ribbon-helix-helix domain-containing protein n=1 Tax=Geopseudomonas aromaticivorans TaxID=2849492 RepID=A0ABS6MWT9_9GAMM|nr:hypothetical protein [Pseudomonas aromaticivorans]MBV2133267.1 hypothetical protein [Pseudomonas aromaticivorans]
MATMSSLNNAVSVRSAELLATPKKKFSVDLPSGIHQQLKIIAAANNTTVRDLLLDGVVNYVFPKYLVNATNKEN